jgi:predicted dehydrogenase
LLDECKPDTVTVAVPTVDHLDVALQVSARKVRLLIEKPIAFDVNQGSQIIAAAGQANVRLMSEL